MAAAPDDLSPALDAVLAEFGTLVRSVGHRHRLADADLDELLQEVRIRLWRARGEREQIRQVGASYVYRTAVSASLDLLRRRRARPAEPLEALAGDAGERAGPSDDPVAQADEAELAEQVAQVVDGIAPARRPVVRMHLGGYPREEIAELLGWSEAKTRNLLYRGLADLRQGLRARGIGDGGFDEPIDHGRTVTS